MKQSLFEQRHQAAWQRFDKRLAFLEKGKKLEGSSDDFAADYRRLCQQPALAQERGYSSHLIDQLQQLAMRGAWLKRRTKTKVTQTPGQGHENQNKSN